MASGRDGKRLARRGSKPVLRRARALEADRVVERDDLRIGDQVESASVEADVHAGRCVGDGRVEVGVEGDDDLSGFVLGLNARVHALARVAF